MTSESTRALSKEMLIFHRLYKERISRRLTSNFPQELSQAEIFALFIINDQGHIAMSDLVERSMMSKQQVTRLMNQLEEKRLVMRIRPSENRRTVVLQPTEAAYALERRMLQDSEAQYDRIFSQLDDDALEEYLSAIRTINRILEQFPTGHDAEPVRKENA